MDDKDFIAAIQLGLPPIKAPDPLDSLEASEGVCAQEDE